VIDGSDHTGARPGRVLRRPPSDMNYVARA
jgi:hypothetical protein